MRAAPPRRKRPGPALALAVAALVAALLGGCGDDGNNPIEVRLKEDTAAQSVLGFPALATKNTTRVGGKDPAADAAGVASAVYPGAHPELVTLVDQGDWQGAFAAAVLMASPLRSPVLITDGKDVPDSTAQAIDTLDPRGAQEAGGAQAIRIGKAGAPGGIRTTSIAPGDPASEAAAIDFFMIEAAGQPSENIVIAGAEDARYAMPAAGWAAKSGDSLLFVQRNSVPTATLKAIRRHEQPGIYILGPASVVSKQVEKDLGRLGRVKRISGPTPVDNAIAFARYSDGSFGWGITDPGHGLVFANVKRTLDAAAAAPLAGSGAHGPLLLVDSAGELPRPLEDYLLDIQPGYRFDPVRGVYNHAWLMGDESAISIAVQARIDSLAEIVPVRRRQGGS